MNVSKLVCERCKVEPATCVGHLVGKPDFEAACDTCCPHEHLAESWCVPVEDVAAWMQTVDGTATQLRTERDQLQLRCNRLQATFEIANEESAQRKRRYDEMYAAAMNELTALRNK